MSTTEKLHEAIERTIEAGYQLDKEAFELLTLIAASEDPLRMMESALSKLSAMDERPIFISRGLLEELLRDPKQTEESNTFPILNLPTEQSSEPEAQNHGIEGKHLFRPFAKDVKSEINIIEDWGSRLTSNGTLQDYLGYFRDRFRKLEKLLRQRIDVKSAASVVDALKAQPNTKLKIIGMITEKKESKQKIILTVEDMQANMTALVLQNASEELQKKTRSLMLDQVVCLSVTKTRSNLLIVEDVVYPEVGQKPQRRAQEPVYAVLTSDMHVGSAKFQRDAFNRFVLWLNGKYGDDRMMELAGHVKYVLIAGDIVDGIGIYPNQAKELAIRDVHKQYRLAAKYIEQMPEYIEIVITPGNHDAPRKALPQPAISEEFLDILRQSGNVHSLGDPCYLSLHGVEVLEYHGRSLDDVISSVPGMSHNTPEKAMRLLLQSRHLAPVYGGKTMLSPENTDSMVIERVPDIFHAGHVHAMGYCNYRGVLVVNSGGWQSQTDYMKKLGFAPTPGKVPVVNLQTLEVTVMSFN